MEHLYIIRGTGQLLYSMPTHHFPVITRFVSTQQYTSSHIIDKMLEIIGQILDDQLVVVLSKFPSVDGLMVYETTDIFCHQATGSCCGMHCCKKTKSCIWDFFFFFFPKTNEVGKRLRDVFPALVTVHCQANRLNLAVSDRIQVKKGVPYLI